MKRHEFTLKPIPFMRIKNKQKVIEMRLYDEKRQKLRVGDFIYFTNTETKEILKVEILELTRYLNFTELYAAYTPKELGYLDGEEVAPSDMEEYYKKDDIDRFGVLAIYINVLNSEID
ncbi:MAG: ASCH domain-containing protein [Bacilli bacterium]|jgi:ASC-1-like (ASCH) protein|nr:ASCH domain-containing protein [Bacillota bacterium]NLI51903.1 ASCH domain-containing protein [Erysipelotrichaceae bacterium]HOE54062.1 ASCH domain-containing protein [Bacilli bacterium]TAH56540.1 MAG: ASCH domain-containing protein [Bacillota bacterium]HOH94568.1 ASCH domain-containing protein [Bacilli bacterium]